MFVESSYSAILDRISKTATERAELLLGRRVVSIRTPEERTSGKQSCVTTDDGSVREFDEVVMSTPLGWLKKYPECFNPSLPPRLRAAINNLTLSQLEKVFITFPTAFWINDKANDSFPGYTNWLRPRYVEETNPHRWKSGTWLHLHPQTVTRRFYSTSMATARGISWIQYTRRPRRRNIHFLITFSSLTTHAFRDST